MRPTRDSAGPSQRQLRAGELIRHALADILMRGDTGDPELEKLAVSVVEVQMSPDLRIATAYVRGLINGQDKLVLAALSGTKYIRGLVAPRIAEIYAGNSVPHRYRIGICRGLMIFGIRGG
jgi:ribosome-binding factor A